MLMRCLYRQTLLSLLEIKLSTLFRPAFSTFALLGGVGKRGKFVGISNETSRR